MNSCPVFFKKLNNKCYTCMVSFLHEENPCTSSNFLFVKFEFNDHESSYYKSYTCMASFLYEQWPNASTKMNYKCHTCMVSFLHEQQPCFYHRIFICRD